MCLYAPRSAGNASHERLVNRGTDIASAAENKSREMVQLFEIVFRPFNFIQFFVSAPQSNWPSFQTGEKEETPSTNEKTFTK